jgi:hypothetical protein
MLADSEENGKIFQAKQAISGMKMELNRGKF